MKKGDHVVNVSASESQRDRLINWKIICIIPIINSECYSDIS